MTFRIVNASTWPLDRVAPYMSDILKQMGRLGTRFPADCTMQALFMEFLHGKKALWLVIEEETDRLAAIAMTHLRTVDATGAKLATMSDLAGSNPEAFAAELCAATEAWARENGATINQIEGRPGWVKLLAQFGYRPHSVLYRKTP